MNAYIRAAKKNSALRAQAAKQLAKREEQGKTVDPGKPEKFTAPSKGRSDKPAKPNARPKGRP